VQPAPGVSTEIFERYQRSEKALVAALTEMYIQGVSTRKVKAISEELCGHSFSASAISGFNKKLDEELGRFTRRELDCEYPYLILDARYEKVRENAVIRSRAVLVAIGIDGMADARCSAWRWPIGKALRVGRSSFLVAGGGRYARRRRVLICDAASDDQPSIGVAGFTDLNRRF
jgi:hypothetical protein